MKPTKQHPATATALKTDQTIRLTAAQAAAYKPSKVQQSTLAKIEHTAAKNKKAGTQPFPGPLRQAFATTPPEILGVKLLPITLGHMVILADCKNPMLDAVRLGMALAAAKDDAEKKRLAAEGEKINWPALQVVEALFIFSQPTAELRRMLANGGPSAILGAAIVLADQLPPFPHQVISQALSAHYMQSMVTSLSIEPDADPEDKKKSFTSKTTTASAGASTSSVF